MSGDSRKIKVRADMCVGSGPSPTAARPKGPVAAAWQHSAQAYFALLSPSSAFCSSSPTRATCCHLRSTFEMPFQFPNVFFLQSFFDCSFSLFPLAHNGATTTQSTNITQRAFGALHVSHISLDGLCICCL